MAVPGPLHSAAFEKKSSRSIPGALREEAFFEQFSKECLSCSPQSGFDEQLRVIFQLERMHRLYWKHKALCFGRLGRIAKCTELH